MTAGSPIAAIDRRALFAAPTDHGKDKLGEAAKVHAANLRPAFAGFDADELRMLDALLDRLALLGSTELAILVAAARRRESSRRGPRGVPPPPPSSTRPLIGYFRLDVRLGPGQASGRGARRVALTAAARGWLAWLSHGVRPAGHCDEVRLKRGLPSSK